MGPDHLYNSRAYWPITLTLVGEHPLGDMAGFSAAVRQWYGVTGHNLGNGSTRLVRDLSGFLSFVPPDTDQLGLLAYAIVLALFQVVELAVEQLVAALAVG